MRRGYCQLWCPRCPLIRASFCNGCGRAQRPSRYNCLSVSVGVYIHQPADRREFFTQFWGSYSVYLHGSVCACLLGRAERIFCCTAMSNWYVRCTWPCFAAKTFERRSCVTENFPDKKPQSMLAYLRPLRQASSDLPANAWGQA